MNFVKVGQWYFCTARIIKAGPGNSPGALVLHTDRGDVTELTGRDAEEMRALLDRYVASGSGRVTSGVSLDPHTGLPIP